MCAIVLLDMQDCGTVPALLVIVFMASVVVVLYSVRVPSSGGISNPSRPLPLHPPLPTS